MLMVHKLMLCKCTQQECDGERASFFYLKLVLGHSKVLANVVIYLRRVIRKKKINNTDEEIMRRLYARIPSMILAYA